MCISTLLLFSFKICSQTPKEQQTNNNPKRENKKNISTHLHFTRHVNFREIAVHPSMLHHHQRLHWRQVLCHPHRSKVDKVQRAGQWHLQQSMYAMVNECGHFQMGQGDHRGVVHVFRCQLRQQGRATERAEQSSLRRKYQNQEAWKATGRSGLKKLQIFCDCDLLWLGSGFF